VGGVPSIPSLDTLEVEGKRVLLRVDINSPIDATTDEIVDDSRIDKSVPTIRELADRGARLVIIAHQGDALDYHNLVSLEPHAGRLSEKLGRAVGFIDDIAGPAARDRIAMVGAGEILLLNATSVSRSRKWRRPTWCVTLRLCSTSM